VVNVKGSALCSRVLWVQLEHGAAGMTKVLAKASPALRAELEAGFAKPRWYPFDHFIELNRLLDELFGAGDLTLVRWLGRYAADATLTTIYRLFYKVGTTHWILGRAVRLWSAHFDSGQLEVLTRGPRTAVLRIRAFETPHEIHCAAIAGWCERSIELSGGADVIVEEPLCRVRGDELCQLEARWR
jgi:eukaryotic-like serine/threonine-protein kinase